MTFLNNKKPASYYNFKSLDSYFSEPFEGITANSKFPHDHLNMNRIISCFDDSILCEDLREVTKKIIAKSRNEELRVFENLYNKLDSDDLQNLIYYFNLMDAEDKFLVDVNYSMDSFKTKDLKCIHIAKMSILAIVFNTKKDVLRKKNLAVYKSFRRYMQRNIYKEYGNSKIDISHLKYSTNN
jgi:hypothetical protein